jgi:hypothetical protein
VVSTFDQLDSQWAHLRPVPKRGISVKVAAERPQYCHACGYQNTDGSNRTCGKSISQRRCAIEHATRRRTFHVQHVQHDM